MLTDGDLEGIRIRYQKALLCKQTSGVATLQTLNNSLADVPALLAEVERQADRLSDCWLLLDRLAHDGCKVAQELLREQQRPAGSEFRPRNLPA